MYKRRPQLSFTQRLFRWDTVAQICGKAASLWVVLWMAEEATVGKVAKGVVRWAIVRVIVSGVRWPLGKLEGWFRDI